ncbi:hypothetical protein [Jatrophihabitans fulvus]
MHTTASPRPAVRPLAVRARRVAAARAALAVVWAGALLAALPSGPVGTGSDLGLAAGLLVAAYPLIDLAALAAGPRNRHDAAAAVIDVAAVAVLVVATVSSTAGAVVAAFGAWAVLSGAAQAIATVRADAPRRARVPLAASGVLSTVAGAAFVVMATGDTVSPAGLSGYAVLGAVFFLVSAAARRRPTAARSA